MEFTKEAVRREGLRLVVALATGFAAGAIFFSGQCGFWPQSTADKLSAVGIIVNMVVGAATVAVAVVAYRLGSRDAVSREEERRNAADVAAGLMFNPIVSLQFICDRIADHVCMATRVDKMADRAARFRRLADGVRRFLAEVDRADIASLALCEKELSLTLSYALGRVRMLPDLCDGEADRLCAGTPGTEDQRRKIEANAREFSALAAEFVSFCERFARTVKFNRSPQEGV